MTQQPNSAQGRPVKIGLVSIDPCRPTTWLRSVEQMRAAGVERVILPWWTAYWGLCYRVIVGRLRHHGIPVTFLCHNVSDHETSRLKDWVFRLEW